MSTDVQPPSPNLTFTSRRIPKLERSSPTAMERQPSRREQGRSSSLTEFISKMLPSRRSEKGHTVREQCKDDGTYNPIDLVFGLHKRRKSDEETSIGSDGSKTRKPISKHHTYRSDVDDETISGKGLKKSGVLRRIFGSVKKEKREKKEEEKEEKGGAIPAYHLPSPKILLDNVSKVASTDETIEELRRAIFKTHRLYEDKKARSEQRRSLRQSDDFLGVQGANPRTGCWDPSDDTTTSEPSQLSTVMEKKFAETRRLFAERKKRLTEIEAMHQEVQERAQAFRELKEQERQEKEEKKRTTSVPRLGRRGRWNVDERGWSSVAEPDLSPIQQSTEGTPISTAVDRLFPMPTATDPAPYIGAGPIEAHDYFGHRLTSSPLARERAATHQVEEVTAPLTSNVTIRRKPVVYQPNRRRDNASSTTVVHNTVELDHIEEPTTPTHQIPKREKSVRLRKPQTRIPIMSVHATGPFLEDSTNQLKLATQDENAATATSLSSVPKKLLPTCEILTQNPLAGIKRRPVSLFHNLPPIYLKDPVAARTPSCPPELGGLHQVWAPPTIIKTEPDIKPSSTNTLTTITTGHAHPSALIVQLDGLQEMSDQSASPALKHKGSHIPSRSSSQHKERQNKTQSSTFPGHPVTIVTSSEHQLDQTKQRTARLCHNASPETDKVEMKNVPISTNTFLQSQQKQRAGAREAARLAFQTLRQDIVMMSSKGQIGDPLYSPKGKKDGRQKAKATQDEKDDTEGRFKCDHELRMNMHQSSTTTATRAGRNKSKGDSIVVWHPSPKRKTDQINGAPVVKDMRAVLINPRSLVSPTEAVWVKYQEIPTSERAVQRLTWEQIDLRETAWSCVIGLFVAMVLLGKAIHIILQTIFTILLILRIILS